MGFAWRGLRKASLYARGLCMARMVCLVMGFPTIGSIRIGPGYIPHRTTRQSRRNSETFFGIPRPVKSAVPHLYAFRILLTEPVDIWNRPNSLAISFLPRPSKCCWMTFALTAEHIAMTTIISRDVHHTRNFILTPGRVTRTKGFI